MHDRGSVFFEVALGAKLTMYPLVSDCQYGPPRALRHSVLRRIPALPHLI